MKTTKKVLVIDVGGTQVKGLVKDWTFDGVSIGFPGPVTHGPARADR